MKGSVCHPQWQSDNEEDGQQRAASYGDVNTKTLLAQKTILYLACISLLPEAHIEHQVIVCTRDKSRKPQIHHHLLKAPQKIHHIQDY
jgi:hypothetical protein